MTRLSQLLALFPLSVWGLFLASLYWLIRSPGWLSLLSPLLVLYGYPVLMFRLHNLLYPLKEGRYDLLSPDYNPWWGGHQLQLVYYACPFLEAVLRTIPGAYSAWLRLWGAKVGKSVYWTPNIEIDDRSLIEIGDHVIIGHKAHFISHVILPYKQKLPLYVKKITLGDQCFIGAGSRLGPGVIVDAHTFLPALSDGPIGTHFKAEQTDGKRQKPAAQAE